MLSPIQPSQSKSTITYASFILKCIIYYHVLSLCSTPGPELSSRDK
jgi:hypothetical protein